MNNTMKKTSNEYAENLMQAMDTVIQERMNKLAFDRTITCKIINQDEKDSNLYWVSTDTMKFKARASGNDKYSKGEEVYVLIPEGNYDNEKIITGSRINDTEKAYNKMKYVSTKEQFVEHNKISFNNEENIKIQTSNDNIETNSAKSLITDIDFKYNLPIERVGVEFSLNAFELFDDNQEIGKYGLLIDYIEKPKENVPWDTNLTTPFYCVASQDFLELINWDDDKSSIYDGDTLEGIPLLKYYSGAGVGDGGLWLFLGTGSTDLVVYHSDVSNNAPFEVARVTLGSDIINFSEIATLCQSSGLGTDINGNWAIIQQYFIQEQIPATVLKTQAIYSSELYGNPYAFTENFNHFVLLPFELSDITKLRQIEIKLFQDGNFKQINKTIELSNVSLSFGFEKDSTNIGNNELILVNKNNN